MPMCSVCGKSKLFLKVDSFGRCSTCEEIYNKQHANKEKVKDIIVTPVEDEPSRPEYADNQEVILTAEEFNKKLQDIDFAFDVAPPGDAQPEAVALTEKPSTKNADGSTTVHTPAGEVTFSMRMSGTSRETTDPAFDVLSDEIDDRPLKYKYKQNIAFMDKDLDYSFISEGDLLEFIPEPDNDYDENAIRVYWNDDAVGYVFKGAVQDILNRWIKNDLPYEAYIHEVSERAKKISYVIGFYK